MVVCYPNRIVLQNSNYQRVTNGSNPAHGDAKRKGLATQRAEVFALLWELSNYRIGFGARFAFLFATLVASNWGIRIARWLREWARRNSSLEEPPSNPNAGDLKCCSLSLVTSYLEVCGQVFAFDRPTCYPCPPLPSSGSHYALYEHGRGKRAHPIYQRVLAQGRSRARAAYQSCLF